MQFTSKFSGVTVVLIAPKTVYHGPGQQENVPGVELRFKDHVLNIDENSPTRVMGYTNLDKIKMLMEHQEYHNLGIKYCQPQIATVIDGRKAVISGPTLEEAIAIAEAKLSGQQVSAVESEPRIEEDDEPEEPVVRRPGRKGGPRIRDGAAVTVPKSAFV